MPRRQLCASACSARPSGCCKTTAATRHLMIEARTPRHPRPTASAQVVQRQGRVRRVRAQTGASDSHSPAAAIKHRDHRPAARSAAGFFFQLSSLILTQRKVHPHSPSLTFSKEEEDQRYCCAQAERHTRSSSSSASQCWAAGAASRERLRVPQQAQRRPRCLRPPELPNRRYHSRTSPC